MHKLLLSGGLGNQLFQFFFVINEFGDSDSFHLDLSYYRYRRHIRNFEIPNVIKNEYLKNLKFIDGSFLYSKIFAVAYRLPKFIKRFLNIISDDNKKIFSNKQIIVGYFQKIGYIPNRLVIKKYFKDFSAFPVPNGSVGIHIRRGDYLLAAHDLHGIIPVNTLINQLFKIFEKNNFSSIYVFSDSDIRSEFDHAIKNTIFRNVNLYYVNNFSLSTAEEFLLMREMTYLICSNSTYSWWAAFSSKRNITTYLPINWYKSKSISKDLLFDGVVLYE